MSRPDALGRTATTSYTPAAGDPLGRLTAVWLPGRTQGEDVADLGFGYAISRSGTEAVTTTALNANGDPVSSVELYDALLRPRQSQSPTAAREATGRLVAETVYDSRGLVQAEQGPWYTSGEPATALVTAQIAVPSRTLYTYDGAGRVTEASFQVDNLEQWATVTEYGGDRVTVVPPAGGVTQTSITDARGRLVTLRQYTSADRATWQDTSYAYDRAGNLAAVADPVGNEWTYAYDLLGRQVSSWDPDRGASTSVFDDAGQVTSTTDARGVRLDYTYDALGRRTAVSEGGQVRASWVFDTLAKGQVTSATRFEGGAEYTSAVTGYDEAYRPLGQQVTIPASEGELAGTYTTSLTYTPGGAVESMTLPAAGGLGAETVTTYYDDRSMPELVTGGVDWGVYVAGTRFDVTGETLALYLGNGRRDDGVLQVDNRFTHGTRRLERTVASRPDGFVMDLRYGYDDAGNPVRVADQVAGRTECYAYDGLRRLTDAWTPANGDCGADPSAAALGGPAAYWTHEVLDEVGNRTRQDRVTPGYFGTTTTTMELDYPAPGSPRPHAPVAVSATRSIAGWYTAPLSTDAGVFGYDQAGNTTSDPELFAGSRSLTWDAEGRLAQVTDAGGVSSFTYTADGDRLVRRDPVPRRCTCPVGRS